MGKNPAFEKFISEWKKRIEELKNKPISKKESESIKLKFIREKMAVRTFQPKNSITPEYINKFHSIESDLELAIKFANANYERQNIIIREKEADISASKWETIKNIIKRILGG
jgi:hypothetical protein